jgi:hypothetical protein
MREFVVRAALHRARLGDAAAAASARLLAETIENPALHAQLAESHAGSHAHLGASVAPPPIRPARPPIKECTP